MSADDIGGLPCVKQDLVQPPFAPEHEQISIGGPLIVEVELVAREVKKVVSGSGAEFHARTFNGSIPGPLIASHEGDSIGNGQIREWRYHAPGSPLSTRLRTILEKPQKPPLSPSNQLGNAWPGAYAKPAIH